MSYRYGRRRATLPCTPITTDIRSSEFTDCTKFWGQKVETNRRHGCAVCVQTFLFFLSWMAHEHEHSFICKKGLSAYGICPMTSDFYCPNAAAEAAARAAGRSLDAPATAQHKAEGG